jgi:hypothetical protein
MKNSKEYFKKDGERFDLQNYRDDLPDWLKVLNSQLHSDFDFLIRGVKLYDDPISHKHIASNVIYGRELK